MMPLSERHVSKLRTGGEKRPFSNPFKRMGEGSHTVAIMQIYGVGVI